MRHRDRYTRCMQYHYLSRTRPARIPGAKSPWHLLFFMIKLRIFSIRLLLAHDPTEMTNKYFSLSYISFIYLSLTLLPYCFSSLFGPSYCHCFPLPSFLSFTLKQSPLTCSSIALSPYLIPSFIPNSFHMPPFRFPYPAVAEDSVSSPRILEMVRWVFSEHERNWLLFVCRYLNCPSLNKSELITHPRYSVSLFWLLDLKEICASLT
jgi:hypothetical protein